MSEEARRLGIRWFEEVWNQGRSEVIDELMSPDAVIHEGDEAVAGRDNFHHFYNNMRATLSDMSFQIKDVLTQDDRVCVRWVCSAKHTGSGLGTPPTGKTVSTFGISIIRVSDGHIVEGWQNWDMLGLLQQIKGSVSKPATYIAREG